MGRIPDTLRHSRVAVNVIIDTSIIIIYDVKATVMKKLTIFTTTVYSTVIRNNYFS